MNMHTLLMSRYRHPLGHSEILYSLELHSLLLCSACKVFLGLLPGSPISIAGLCEISWSLYLFGSYSNINWLVLSEIDVLP